MVNFIELHRTGYPYTGSDAFAVNIAAVVSYGDHEVITSRSEMRVKESAADITALIKDAGQNFVKKDPRIDNSPLSWAELCDMVGQPVWGENQQRWFLVAQVSGEKVHLSGVNKLEIYYSCDLIAKPLYAVKG